METNKRLILPGHHPVNNCCFHCNLVSRKTYTERDGRKILAGTRLHPYPPDCPVEQLAQLRGHQDQGGQGDALHPCLGLEGDGAKGLAQEGHVDHQELEQYGDTDGAPQPGIAEEPLEGRLAGGAGGQGVEELGEDQDGEAHGPRLPDLRLVTDRLNGSVGEEAAAQMHVHADQGDHSHDQAYIDDVNPHVPVDHPVVDGSGRAIHQIVGLRVHTHGQRGGRIGQEVDPEQLGGQQRHGHASHAGLRYAQKPCKDHSTEDREDLSHVGAEQVAQELADVVEYAPALSHSLDDGCEIVVRQDHLG